MRPYALKNVKECKRIGVVYFHDESYKNKKSMTCLGTDGILYTFEVVPRKAIPLMEPLSKRKVTNFRANGDITEPKEHICMSETGFLAFKVLHPMFLR